MTIEEFNKKEFVNEEDLTSLTLEQMNEIANPEKEYETSEERRAMGRVYGKAYRARKKAEK